MNCRNCHLPIHEVPSTPPNVGTHWVHANTDQYPCLDSDGKQTLDQAEPQLGYPLDNLAAAASDYKIAVGQLEDARSRRDQLIREAVAAEIPPQQIADASDLKTARIYQIRDNRR